MSERWKIGIGSTIDGVVVYQVFRQIGIRREVSKIFFSKESAYTLAVALNKKKKNRQHSQC